jgi:hypothetical protein
MCCWPLPAQSLFGPSPLGLATIFYCLRFETSLFVASYDSQGHGGGIRPRLHTAFSQVLPFMALGEPNRDHHFQQFTLLRVYPLLREPCVNSVATLWFHYSGFQAVLTEPLPSDDHIYHNIYLIVHFVTIMDRQMRFYMNQALTHVGMRLSLRFLRSGNITKRTFQFILLHLSILLHWIKI